MEIEIDAEKFSIPEHIQREWQEMLDLLAGLMEVPAALIMKANPSYVEVLGASQTEENPYSVGERQDIDGVYCEKVIRSKEKLFVRDALRTEKWKDNPDIELGMICYLGFPICWPNGEVFGTLCVLDTREREFSEKDQEVMKQFKKLVEHNLELTLKNHKLEKYTSELLEQAHHDPLTGLNNRRYFHKTLEEETERSERYGHPLSFVMIDINGFKRINDVHSHSMGDEVLCAVSRLLEWNVRDIDTVVRYGGDEFLIMMPETSDSEGRLKSRLKEELHKLNAKENSFNFPIELAIGQSIWDPEQDWSVEDAIQEADGKMYAEKKRQRQ